MSNCRGLCIVLVVVLSGCTSDAPPNANPVKADPELEKTVRIIIAEQMKVNPASIDMKRPLSARPLKADDLDLVEMVMTLEERLGVTIPDSAIDKGPERLTPADLVSIAAGARANPPPPRKK